MVKNMAKKKVQKGRKTRKAKQATCAYCEIKIELDQSTSEWREWCIGCAELIEKQTEYA